MLHAAALMAPAAVPLPLSLGTPAQAPGVPMRVTLSAGRHIADAVLDGEPLPTVTPEPDATHVVAVTPQEARPGSAETAAESVAASRTTPFGEYLTPDQLTRTARPIWVDNLELGDPRQTAGEGDVTMELLINEHGRVVATRVLVATVPTAFLNRAMRAFRNASFEPGQVFDKPVKSSLRVAIHLDRSGVQVSIPRGPINAALPPPQLLPP